jgi:hypothetical protein
MPATSTLAATNDRASTPNGRAAAPANSQAPSGLATNWFPMVKVAISRALAAASLSGATTAGNRATAAVSAIVSQAPSRENTT